MSRKPRPVRTHGYNIVDSAHLTGNIFRVSWEGFLRLTLHSYERRKPPILHLGGLHLRVKSVRVLEQLPDSGWIVEIEEWQ